MATTNYSKVSKILAGIELPNEPPRATQADIFQVWSQAAGSDIAYNTINLQIEDQVLSVTVNSPTWAHALINHQTTILNRLVESGYENLADMTIRVGVLSGRKSPRTTMRTTTVPRASAITPKLRKLFIQIAENASNPETKEAFLRLSQSDSREQ